MKTLITAAVAATLALGGCAAEAPTPPTPPTPEPTVEEASAKDRYIETVHRLAPLTNGMDDAILFDAAETVCILSEEGERQRDIVNYFTSERVDYDISVAVVSAAVHIYCPG